MNTPRGHKLTWGSDLTGYVTTAQNVGAGNGIFRDEAPAGTLNFKSLIAGTGIGIAAGADDLTISNSLPENTSVSNVGAGAGQIYRDKTADQINLKTLVAGANIGITNNADDITIAFTGTIPTGFRDVSWIGAENFHPAAAPLVGAPLVWYSFTDGFTIKAFKLAAGIESEATIVIPIHKVLVTGQELRTSIYWHSDNADTANALGLKIGMAFLNAANLLNNALTYYNFINSGGTGADRLATSYYHHTIAGAAEEYAFIKFSIRRSVDIHAGNAFIHGLRLDFIGSLF